MDINKYSMHQVRYQQGSGAGGGWPGFLCPLPDSRRVRLPRVCRLHEALQPDPGHPARGLPAAGQWTSRCHHTNQSGHGEDCQDILTGERNINNICVPNSILAVNV